jgi:hypothetical protein
MSIKNRNDENKQDNIFFVFYYRCDSHATKDVTRFDWIIHDHVIHELYCLNLENKNERLKDLVTEYCAYFFITEIFYNIKLVNVELRRESC